MTGINRKGNRAQIAWHIVCKAIHRANENVYLACYLTLIIHIISLRSSLPRRRETGSNRFSGRAKTQHFHWHIRPYTASCPNYSPSAYCHARADEYFCSDPHLVFNYYLGCVSEKRRVAIIMACSAKKTTLRYYSIIPNYYFIQRVQINIIANPYIVTYVHSPGIKYFHRWPDYYVQPNCSPEQPKQETTPLMHISGR